MVRKPPRLSTAARRNLLRLATGEADKTAPAGQGPLAGSDAYDLLSGMEPQARDQQVHAGGGDGSFDQDDEHPGDRALIEKAGGKID